MVGMSFNACKGDSESAVWKDMGARRERRRTIRKAPESLGRGGGEWLAQLCSEDGEQLRPQVFWKKSQHDLSVAGKEKKESRMMSEAPWMLRPHSEDGKTG